MIPFGYREVRRKLADGSTVSVFEADEVQALMLREYMQAWAGGNQGGDLGFEVAEAVGNRPPEEVLLNPFPAGVLIERNRRNCYIDLDDFWEYSEFFITNGSHEPVVSPKVYLSAFTKLVAGTSLVDLMRDSVVCDTCRRPVGHTDCVHIMEKTDPAEIAAWCAWITIDYFRHSTPALRLAANWGEEARGISALAAVMKKRLESKRDRNGPSEELDRKIDLMGMLVKESRKNRLGCHLLPWSSSELDEQVGKHCHLIRINDVQDSKVLIIETNLMELI